jgi:hypothetical protein
MSKIVFKEFIRDLNPVIVDEHGSSYVRGQIILKKQTLERKNFTKEITVKEFRPAKAPRIGVMVALDDGRWGWSIINAKEEFDGTITHEYEVKYEQDGKQKTKKLKVEKPVWTAERVWEYGTRLAIERAEGEQPVPAIIPAAARSSIKKFERRVKGYLEAKK